MNKKEKCEKCEKLYRIRSLHRVKDFKGNKLLLCFFCKKKNITNKFYIPPKKKNRFQGIGNFTMSSQEIGFLRNKLLSQGFSYQQVRIKIGQKFDMLNKSRRMSKYNKTMFDKQKKKAEQLNEEFKEEFKKLK